jgi:hypothetical protein
MQEKGDENYVKFFDKNQNIFIYFCHARTKMIKNYVENFHKNHNLGNLFLSCKRQKTMKTMLKILKKTKIGLFICLFVFHTRAKNDENKTMLKLFLTKNSQSRYLYILPCKRQKKMMKTMLGNVDNFFKRKIYLFVFLFIMQEQK